MDGMLCNVLRDSYGDTTNGGVTGRANEVVLTGADVPGVFPASDRLPELALVGKRIGHEVHLIAVPAEYVGDDGEPTRHVMFGGNWIWSCDSRFRAVSPAPIPVHDRVEG